VLVPLMVVIVMVLQLLLLLLNREHTWVNVLLWPRLCLQLVQVTQ
jgi:hypothetical protein